MFPKQSLGETLVEWLIGTGLFGSNFKTLHLRIEAGEERGHESEEDIDLDDTIPAFLLELGVEVFLASATLPYIFLWFWPRIRGILRINDSGVE